MTDHTTPLQHLEAHLLRFVCEVETPLRLHVHKGSALRGAWVEALMDKACPQPEACSRLGAACMVPQGCPIAALVGPADDERARGRDVPRPYVLEPPADSRIEYSHGDILEWQLALFGKAVEWFPYAVMAARHMGECGLGLGLDLPGRRGKGRFRLREMWAVNPLGGLQQRLYTHGESYVHSPGLPITYDQVVREASRLRTDRIQLHFKTPLRLGKDIQETTGATRKLVRELPPFHTLIQRLDGRLRDLACAYSTNPQHAHTTSWPLLPIDKARQVSAEGSVEWLDLHRYSSRQDRRLPMGGLTGSVTYTGELEPFLPLLVWGQFSHVGKYAVMGNGGYDLGR